MTDHAGASAPLMLSVSGCRGIVGASLTPELIAAFACAAAGWIAQSTGAPQPTVVLACDGRRGGPVLKDIAAASLAACGCRVIDIGVATTPTVGVMVTHHRAHGGLTLTASHNPGQWNGLKVIDATGAAPGAEQASQIIARYKERRLLSATPDAFGAVTHDDSAAKVHVARVMDALASVADIAAIRARRFQVVLDSVNASGARAGHLLLDELNCQVTHLNADNSGIFPHAPEPTAENLAELCTKVAAARADVGFAQDPDADRLAILDESGRYIGEEYTLALAAMALLGAPGAPRGVNMAVNLSTSRMIDDVAERHGAKVARSAVGEANVVAAMRAKDCLLGGEGNGGVIWPRITMIRDSLGAMALTLALLARERTPLSAIVAGTPSYAIEKRKVDLRPGLTDRALAAAERVAPGGTIDRQDGVRVDFRTPSGKGWLHVRASNTEPILRLIAEAPTAAEAREVLDRAAALIDQA